MTHRLQVDDGRLSQAARQNAGSTRTCIAARAVSVHDQAGSNCQVGQIESSFAEDVCDKQTALIVPNEEPELASRIRTPISDRCGSKLLFR